MVWLNVPKLHKAYEAHHSGGVWISFEHRGIFNAHRNPDTTVFTFYLHQKSSQPPLGLNLSPWQKQHNCVVIEKCALLCISSPVVNPQVLPCWNITSLQGSAWHLINRHLLAKLSSFEKTVVRTFFSCEPSSWLLAISLSVLSALQVILFISLLTGFFF